MGGEEKIMENPVGCTSVGKVFVTTLLPTRCHLELSGMIPRNAGAAGKCGLTVSQCLKMHSLVSTAWRVSSWFFLCSDAVMDAPEKSRVIAASFITTTRTPTNRRLSPSVGVPLPLQKVPLGGFQGDLS